MNAKETVIYLYEHSHIQQHEHHKTIMDELNKPVTEHPDVQKLISQMVVLQAKYKTLKASHKNLVDACRAGGIELEFCHSRTKRLLDTLAMIEQALEEAEKI